jgi:glutaredoxin
MARFRGLLDKARKLADERLPDEVKRAGRRIREEVVRRAPAPIAEVLAGSDAPTEPQQPPEAAESGEPTPTFGRERAEDVLRRVHQKAEHGLKPEDRLVVVYATDAEAEAVAEIRRTFDGIETTFRTIDLDQERPQTRTQIAQLTGVMVPPWVYINGRFWGAQFEMVSLRGSGDLEHVVANRLDQLSADARRIGRIHDTYSDDLTVDNILARWKLGHILCVDDLDAWFEVDKDGTERFFYQGGPRPVEDMPTVAREIVLACEAEEIEAQWLLEPSVHLG